MKRQSNLGIFGRINWLRTFEKQQKDLFLQTKNPNMTHWKTTDLSPPLPALPRKAQNMADKNGWPHANTEVKSKNHLSVPQWFLVCYAYGSAVVRALLNFARWKPLTQRLITLFIYYYLCPEAKNTINLAKLELKDSALTCFQFKLNHGFIK